MARDNSPKIRQQRKLERKQGSRARYDRILIVSEGSKTEPLYFREIRAAFRLHSANIVVQPSELGTDPLQVVQYAQKLFEEGDPHKKIIARSFERVYAVFDRDDHQGYHNGLVLADSLHKKLRNDEKQPVIFQAIPSIPCFEFWLLLHFEDIQHWLHRDEVMTKLKKLVPDYEKGIAGSFKKTRDYLKEAVDRAKGLAENNSAYDDTQPYTRVHELVELLVGFGGQNNCISSLSGSSNFSSSKKH
jgi:hypothetical protein